jgi:HAD superfamily hydrolase (TIGR01509 family)
MGIKEETKIRPAGVIFDVDGLMLDTEGPVFALWTRAGKPLGWDIKAEVVMRTLGIDREGARTIFLQEYGPGFPYEKIRDEFRRLYYEEFEKGAPHKPGLVYLLDHLAALGIPLAVASSSLHETVIWKLRKAGILDRFVALACGDEVRNGKPAPDIFLLAAERLGQKPSDCVGFEDSPAGLQGLHAAGIRSVFIKDLTDPPPEVLATVWHRCADLAEARKLFE